MYQDSYSYQLVLVRVRVDNSAYRGRVFACHNIFDEFFTHVEYENLSETSTMGLPEGYQGELALTLQCSLNSIIDS